MKIQKDIISNVFFLDKIYDGLWDRIWDDGVDLIRLEFSPMSDLLRFVIKVRKGPSAPPKKWVVCNYLHITFVVQVPRNFKALQNEVISDDCNPIDLVIESDAEGYVSVVMSGGIDISFSASAISVSEITPG
ncbi:immunity 50 family protein [Chromobacterium violaceum]|uniref:immunity 50 family protein n=1 Tax=Chromobacterium violaceum TaxID=536 RepID=UPI001CE16E25|nr:immunity 50 family protein [Chromobacterium violaceum]